jgi:GT2 family glycosyltransferase
MQDYKGKITALVIVDGGSRFNRPTVEAGYRMQAKYPNIDVQVVDKTNRYGRVHSNNLGLKYCQENNIEYLLILDGDTSISLESISSFVRMAEHDKEVAGLSGSIKVRNLNSHITKLTYLEYALGIVLSRFSLGRLGYTNNISGAKYQFRFPYTVMYS